MARRTPTHNTGFTLLEICIAIIIVVTIMSVAIPSLTGLLDQNQEEAQFKSFDEMAREAHRRSISEHRAYILIWTREKNSKMTVLLRPDGISDPKKEEKDVVRRWDIQKGDSLTLNCPAALIKSYEAVWTFWPSGACEPVKVTFKPKVGKGWVALYNPFTVDAVVHYE